LEEETGGSGENHPTAASHCQTLSHNVEYPVFVLSRIRTHNISDDWQRLAVGWFSPDPPVSSSNKTDRHDIYEILLKMALKIP
jgi:hypothetical protein